MNFMKWLTLTEIREFFTKGHERSVKAKKNILGSFIVKGGSILINLLLVPLTLNYLNPVKYGIWITLTSVIAWFGFFDIGLGSGLRNRFAEAVAIGNYKLAKTYISTTYAILSIIIAVILLLFYIINPFINWAIILNAGGDPALQNELSLLALIVFSFFCFSFILKIIATVLTADQQPAKASLFNLFANKLKREAFAGCWSAVKTVAIIFKIKLKQKKEKTISASKLNSFCKAGSPPALSIIAQFIKGFII